MPTRSGARCRTRLTSSFKRPRNAVAGMAAFAAFWPSALATSSLVEAKTPGKTYCFYKVCHRVMTLDETRRAVGKRIVVHASHYDDPSRDRFNPSNLTSSGEFFRAGSPDNAASPKLPNGTVILAWNPATRQSAVLRINNAGPYWRNRTLDVSRAAADHLGFGRTGVAPLHIQVISPPTQADVTYRKGRRYAAVPGPIGTYATLELAAFEASRRMGITVDPSASAIQVASADDAALPSASIISSIDSVDAATVLAHLPADVPASGTIVTAEATLPSPPEFDGTLARLATLVSPPASAAEANPIVALASASSEATTTAKRVSEEKVAKARRSLRPMRQLHLASLNAAPAISGPPARRRAAEAAQRKQAAALDRRRDRREPPRTVSKSASQAQQQRLADLDDFDEDDIRPARTMRRVASNRSRYFED